MAIWQPIENEQSLNACFTEVSQLTEASGSGSDSALVQILTKLTGAPLGLVSCSKVSKANAISAKFVEVIKRCQKHVTSVIALDNSQLRFCRQLEELGMVLKDLDESFTRSSGPGGQNVNKAENLSKALNSYELL